MDIINFFVLLSFLLNLVFAFVIHFRSSRSKANILFELLVYAVSGWCFAMFFYRQSSLPISIFWAKVLYFFPTYIPACFLLFSLYFTNVSVKKSVAYAIIILNILISMLSLLPNTIVKDVIIIPGREKIIVFGWAYFLYTIYIPALFIASYCVLLSGYFKTISLVKSQIRYIFIGSLFSSSIAMFTNLILPTFGIYDLNWAGQVSTFIWVGSVTYAIVKHRLMDIRLVVARTIAYTLLVAILAVVYAIGLFFIGSVFFPGITTNEDQLIISTLLALFMAFSFQPLRKYLEAITDKIFFKAHYNSQELLAKLGNIMSSSLSLSYLVEMVLKELFSKMKVRFAFFILTQNHSIIWVKGGGDTIPNPEFNESKICELIKKTVDASGENLLVFDEMTESDDKKTMRDHNINVLLPLVVKDEAIGALLLGEKSSGEIYSSDDIEVLKILIPEVAVAVKNALSYEEIKRFNVTLEQEVKHATEELQNANERLKQLDKIKDEFVSLASHELRTPMTVIKSYVWLMLQGKTGNLNEKQKTYLERTYVSTDRLINLVNDMLNVSRIESGRFTLDMKIFDIKKLVEDVVEELLPKAQELGVNLNVKQSEEDNLIVNADPERVEQVLINLVGNALKFTPKDGKIAVSFSQNNDMIQIHVSDTGEGISKEDLPKLFQKFGVVGSDYLTKQNTQGTGLGLYLSKSIIELQGGKIWVESDGEGKGSTFSFSLKKEKVIGT